MVEIKLIGGVQDGKLITLDEKPATNTIAVPRLLADGKIVLDHYIVSENENEYNFYTPLVK